MENIEKTLYWQYANDVVNNRIVACENVILSCRRFLNDLERDDLEFRPRTAKRAIDFIGILKHFKGESSGKNFKLSPFQSFIVANLTGWYWKESGDRRFTSAYIEMARKGGKALALDTPIPTPDGWTTMGDLQVGDYVWGADGKPTRVTFATEVMRGHKCYKVRFSDGEEVTADAEHNWLISRRHKKEPYVQTTEEIYNSKWKRVRSDGKGTEYLCRIPVNKPTQSDDIDLPVDPYTLGCWLADGSLHKPCMTCGDFDLQIYDRVSDIYGPAKARHYKDERAVEMSYAGDVGKNNSKLRHALKSAEVLHDKHIPEIYLRAGTRQRWELLQGFMDCDGYVCERGQCEFTQRNERVADGMCEILSSLGITYSRVTKIPTLNGKACNPVARVQFYTDQQRPCFTLPRKFNRLKEHLNKRMDYKSIVDIVPVESVPVRCITVDNEDHLYLFGRRFSVTHNTALIAALAMYYFIADGEDGAEIDIAANNFEQAKICFDFIQQYCRQLDSKGKDLKVYRSSVDLKTNASRINVFSADASGKDGFNASVGIIDEFHSAKTTGMRDIIKSSMGMRRNPMLLTITSAGFDKSLPCYKLRQTCEEVLRGVKEDDSQFSMIFGLDTGDDWTDENAWQKSNPNLGNTTTYKYLREMVQSAKNNPTEEVSVRTKNLGEWLSTSSIWIPDNYVLNAMAPVSLDDFDPATTTVIGGVDLASTNDLACVSLLIQQDGDPTVYFKNRYYLPASALVESSNRELYKYWQRTGQLTIMNGNVTDYDLILNDLMKISQKFVILKIGVDPWNASQFLISCVENGLNTIPISQSMANLNRPTKELERLIRKDDGSIVIDNSEVTLFCYRNCVPKFDWNENIKITKENYEQKIDGVVAQIIALCTWLDVPRYGGGVTSI